MTFEEEFPTLIREINKSYYWGTGMVKIPPSNDLPQEMMDYYDSEDNQYIKCKVVDLKESCLDKERVRDAMETIKNMPHETDASKHYTDRAIDCLAVELGLGDLNG